VLKNYGKWQKVFVGLIKALTFASPFELRFERKVGGRAEKIFESLETTARKSSIYGKVTIAKKYR